jgi:hypothetical protein
MSGGYTDMHVHCVPRDGAVSFRGWRQLLEALGIQPPAQGFEALLAGSWCRKKERT